ncbi:uncharacterized protein LOC131597408 [Vicia villosa]|uniref:uncharacterized protein LOC131597408 n=1 Tax=Vicia villosa TaxID=3911 RepID=UPI00273A9267|nr:uncharacterized protein LOC131597408 [Vicia villosa]
MSPPVVIPRPCLDSTNASPIPPKPVAKPLKLVKKSFAQAVNNICDIPISQLPQSIVKGDRISITIPEDEYLAGIASCKFNLHGRIFWPKGSAPLKVDALRQKLSTIWSSLAKWGLTSLSKGYFEFSFSNIEDLQRVRSASSWNLNPGLLKVFAWTKDFNPNEQRQSSAQAWIRISGLSQEYWRPKILYAIASAIGSPICMDETTTKSMFDRSFGHFARIMVDLDLIGNLRNNILIERKNFAFFVDVTYENIPDFCDHCKIIGHNLANYRKLKKNEAMEKDNPKSQHRKVYVEKQTRDKSQNNVSVPSTQDDLIQIIENPDKSTDSILGHHNEMNTQPEEGIISLVPINGFQDEHVEINTNQKLQLLEQDLEENSGSSSGSEFVDATQDNINAEADEYTTNPKVQHDMVLLKESWAN